MNFFKRTAILFFLVIFCAGLGAAQNFPEPRQEKLLNGLKLLMWRDTSAPKVTVKLRIHDGAAFDPKDKMGTMALVADILFPNIAETKSYFAEDLEGSLDVTSNYDYIQITATGKPDEIQTILETISTAVTNLPITPENFAIVRDRQLEKVKELEKNPSYIADRAVAKRLFGDFPYGRSADGTTESLMKIDRPDLLLARDRFFTADNATLAVTGNVNADDVYRVTRQLFGAWEKAESKIPATFRQPDAPDTKELIIESPNAEKTEMRLAAIAAPRNSKDFYATQILNFIWQGACLLNDESMFGKSYYQSYLLRGVFEVKRNFDLKSSMLINTSSRCSYLPERNNKFMYSPTNQSDFDAAKLLSTINLMQKARNTSDLADLWLDVDTFKLISVKDEISKLYSVTFADVHRVSEDLLEQPMVKVVVKKSEVAKQ
ncbi:MAG: M16 family metallopeptidase [Pyrinomonadaceae bacterium]